MVSRNPTGFTVVVALHPECPCSLATLEELDSISAESRGRFLAQVLFVELPGLPPADASSLWRRATRIAGVTLVRDPGGAEARLFGMCTSGDTRLYAPDGRLVFRGGITAARGHVGDNPGQAVINRLLVPGTVTTATVATPVFGCALASETRNPLRP